MPAQSLDQNLRERQREPRLCDHGSAPVHRQSWPSTPPRVDVSSTSMSGAIASRAHIEPEVSLARCDFRSRETSGAQYGKIERSRPPFRFANPIKPIVTNDASRSPLGSGRSSLGSRRWIAGGRSTIEGPRGLISMNAGPVEVVQQPAEGSAYSFYGYPPRTSVFTAEGEDRSASNIGNKTGQYSFFRRHDVFYFQISLWEVKQSSTA